METTGPPGWPGDDAARDGAPLDVRAGGADPRLIAAERVIGQLRALIGALVADAAEDGTPVVVTAEQLADPRLRRLQVRAGRNAVALRLAPAPEAAEAVAGSTDGAASGAADGHAAGDAGGPEVRSAAAASQPGAARAGVQRAGDSAWMRRLERVAQAHQSHRDSPDHATDDDRDDDAAGNSASDPDDAAHTRPPR